MQPHKILSALVLPSTATPQLLTHGIGNLPVCGQSCSILTDAQSQCNGGSNTSLSVWSCFCKAVWSASVHSLITACATTCTTANDNRLVQTWYTKNCGIDEGASEHGGDTVSDTGVSLCNKTIDNANASGVFTYHVDYENVENVENGTGPIWIPDPSWAITVNQRDKELEQGIWYSTGGQNYSNDLAIGYDVCTYSISNLPLNTIELGQDDPGDCSIIFSSQCREAILDGTSQSAYKWISYASPPPYSNLSAGVLPTIFTYILTDIGEDGYTFPKECSQEFGYKQGALNPVDFDVSTDTIALTGYNDTALDMGCPLQVGDKTYYNLGTGAPSSYDEATRSVHPILTVYMPVANIEHTWQQGNAVSKLTCAHVKQFHGGSRVSPALPSGTPYSYGQGLGKGAIAGIVLSVVVFIAIVAGLLAYFYLRKRQRQMQQVGNQPVAKHVAIPEIDDTGRAELTPADPMHEPDSKRDVPEMDDAQGLPGELSVVGREPVVTSGRAIAEMGDGQGKPAELGT